MENAVLSAALRLVSTLLLCATGGGLGLAAAQKQERRWGQVHTFARLLSYIGQTLQYLPPTRNLPPSARQRVHS